AISVLEAAGASRKGVGQKVRAALTQMPSTQGASVSQSAASRAFGNILVEAESDARAMGDEYTSTEHLLIALAKSDTDAGRILNEEG
ncbi:Clp protease N-terminal domain-containing protein, partial [Enterococcus faecalis]|nr:Clp protease N-terminal domain-containing protein [Enterococcus faecalis]